MSYQPASAAAAATLRLNQYVILLPSGLILTGELRARPLRVNNLNVFSFGASSNLAPE